MKKTQKKVINILNKKGNGFGVSSYKMSSLAVFQSLSNYDVIILNSIVAAIGVVIMVQIRALRSNATAQMIDTSDSYRLYKSRIIKAEPGQILKTCLAAAAAFPFLGETPEDVEQTLAEIVKLSAGNAKVLSGNPTKSNHILWIHGAMSQIGGFLNSCPATNPSIFGISNPLSLDVRKIIELIDVPNKPSYEFVISAVREAIITNPIDGQVSESLIFKEGTSGLKVATPLEEEVLGPNFIIREDVGQLRVGVSGSIPNGAPTIDDIKKHLSAFEFIRYQQATIIGARDVLINLNRKVVFSMASQDLKEDSVVEESVQVVDETIASQKVTTRANVPEGILKTGQRTPRSTQGKR
jgi:hypothetical protein